MAPPRRRCRNQTASLLPVARHLRSMRSRWNVLTTLEDWHSLEDGSGKLQRNLSTYWSTRYYTVPAEIGNRHENISYYCLRALCMISTNKCIHYLVTCGCFGNMCTCIYCVLYCLYRVLYCFVYVYLFLFVTSVRTTATEWQLNCSK